MNLVKGVFATVIVLIALLVVTGQTRGGDKKGLTTDGSKQASVAPAVKSKGISAAAAFSAGMPADSPAPAGIYINSAKVEAARAGNHLVYDGDLDKRPYKVSTRNRDGGPENVDVHALQSDIWYILGGNATVVTGGTVVNPKTVAPNQIHGTAVEGGEAHHLSKGDVLIIPKGTPHWVKSVEQAPFFYMEFKFTG